jgi:hypothetical protein
MRDFVQDRIKEERSSVALGQFARHTDRLFAVIAKATTACRVVELKSPTFVRETVLVEKLLCYGNGVIEVHALRSGMRFSNRPIRLGGVVQEQEVQLGRGT